jgi:hypothetical protein
MGERRYTDQEEALETKSLRRIIAAYAKYELPPTPLLLFSPLPERILPPVPSPRTTTAAAVSPHQLDYRSVSLVLLRSRAGVLFWSLEWTVVRFDALE